MNKLLNFLAACLLVLGLGAGFTSGCKSDDARERMDPETQVVYDQAEANLDHYMAQLLGMEPDTEEFTAVLAQAVEVRTQLAEMEAEVAREESETWIDVLLGLLSGTIPGVGIAKEWLLGLAFLIYERPRQHAWATIKDFDIRHPIRSLKPLMRMVGLKHSSDDAHELLDVVMRKAKAGNLLPVPGENGAIKLVEMPPAS